MGRAPCCDKANVKRGPWSPEEDAKLKEFIDKNGTGGNWIALPQKAGLKRCGKSCRLRWLNYLRPHIKHGEFSDDEDRIICTLYANIGSRWSIIAAQLPGRTDNDIKNYWNTKLKKKLMGMVPSFDQRKNPSFSNSNHSLQTMPQISQSFSTLSQIYGDFTASYYTPSIKPNNILYNNNVTLTSASSYAHSDNSLISPMQFYPGKDNMLMFGGAEPSCSSSDGSCSQISYGKEIKQENMNNFHHQGPGGGFNISNDGSCYDIQECNKLFDHYGDHEISTWGDDQKQNTINAPTILNNNNSQLQYDLEEVKQLISSNSGCNSSLFFNDDKSSMFYYG